MMFKTYIRTLTLALFLSTGSFCFSQCPITMTVNTYPGGQVSFFATPSLTNGVYSWVVSNSTPSAGLGLSQTSTTYSANGVYTAYCTFTNVTTGCTFTTLPFTFTISTACSISVTSIPAVPSTSCNASASVSTTGNCGGTTYTWSNGFVGSNPTNLCGGFTYTVVSSNTSSSNCCPNLMTTLSIPSCSLLADFTVTPGVPSGQMNFTSTSTGTLAGVTYTWDYGDGNINPGGASVSHTYVTNGNYTVTLLANNNGPVPNCISDTAKQIVVSNVIVVPCNLNASYIYNQSANGFVSFTSTSTGTTGASTYTWNFGDGFSSGGAATNHTYATNGIYTPTLTVTNSSACINSASASLTVNSIIVPCFLNADFTHTVVAPGQVNFSSSSTGTTANTLYFWNFGDGFYATGPFPSHNFSNNGAYNVMLIAKDTLNNNACRDTMIASVNITGAACWADAAFNLSPGNQPQYWIATPVSPWTVTNAVWSWGDGSSSNGLYTSHMYAQAGNYNICLSVTISCGATDSACVSAYLYRGAEDQSIVYVNILPPALSNSLEERNGNGIGASLYPNPSDGRFNLALDHLEAADLKITIYDLKGAVVHHEKIPAAGDSLTLPVTVEQLEKGIYLIRVENGSRSLGKKIVISKD